MRKLVLKSDKDVLKVLYVEDGEVVKRKTVKVVDEVTAQYLVTTLTVKWLQGEE